MASHSKFEHRVHIRQVLECSQQYNHIFVQVSVWPAGDRFPWPLHHQTVRNSTILQGSHHQGVYQAPENQGTAVAHWYGKCFPSFCACSSKNSTTCLLIPHSEAHGTMVERGDGNSIQSCEGGRSQCHLARPPTRWCHQRFHSQCIRSSCGCRTRAARQWLMAATGLFQPAAQTGWVEVQSFQSTNLYLYLAVRHLLYFPEGRESTAFTDHKPLTFTFDKHIETLS